MASSMGRGRSGRRPASRSARLRGVIAIVLAAVVALVALSATLHAASSRPPRPLGVGGRWHLIFDSDFQTLERSQWSTSRDANGTTDPGFNSDERECLDPSEVTVSRGVADLRLVSRPETCEGQQEPYAGSVLTTLGKFQFTYGFIQARVWLPGRGGHITDWPAIWAVGYNWPNGGELDVIESYAGQACWHFHDPLGGPGGCSGRNFTGGWHTFGADWQPGIVRWYYDGRKVGTISSGITASPMHLILDLAITTGADAGPAQLPARLRVSYVRVWQH